MHLSYHSYFLTFKNPFGISKLTRKGTDTILVEIKQNGIIGYGEAVLPPYLKEKPEEIIQLLGSTAIPDFKIFTLTEIDQILAQLPSSIDRNPAYYAAIDMALHDLLSKTTLQSIQSLYGISPNRSPLSSYTIAFSTPQEIVEKLKDSTHFNLIKLKLGGINDIDTIKEIRKQSSLPISVDFNQAWHKPDLELIDLLEKQNCQYIEEPFNDNQALKDLITTIPILADESFQGLSSFEKLPPQFTGINIKLMKCGGLREAFKIIKEANKRGLKILLGCMSGSSCAVAAMSHFALLAHWIDLDGPALISNDPFSGLTYKNGKIILKEIHGMGVELN